MCDSELNTDQRLYGRWRVRLAMILEHKKCNNQAMHKFLLGQRKDIWCTIGRLTSKFVPKQTQNVHFLLVSKKIFSDNKTCNIAPSHHLEHLFALWILLLKQCQSILTYCYGNIMGLLENFLLFFPKSDSKVSRRFKLLLLNSYLKH